MLRANSLDRSKLLRIAAARLGRRAVNEALRLWHAEEGRDFGSRQHAEL